ncbi:MAG: hypothetical protein FWC43_13280, partial [Planctomycetaceae bacterium]|nr:hypothetical protein [Planctomycetaceae bacterium]
MNHAKIQDTVRTKKTAPGCGFEFPPPERGTHEVTASSEGILSGEVTDTEYDIEAVSYYVHQKRGAADDDPRTLRVDYRVGFSQYQPYKATFPLHERLDCQLKPFIQNIVEI